MLFNSLLGLASVACAAVAPSNHVFENIDAVPRGWSFDRYGLPDEPIRLEVSLREQNLQSFEQLVLAISSPDHPKYGQHLEQHEVADLLRPHDDTYEAVLEWLKLSGVNNVATNHDYVTFRTSVSNAERMLSTRFAWYTHETDGQEELRTDGYSLPSSLNGHVNFIHPTVRFPTVRQFVSPVKVMDGSAVKTFSQWKASIPAGSLAVAPPDAVCNQAITPQCLLKLYNVHYGAKKAGNKLAFASFLNEYARYNDLTEFETAVAPYANGQNFTVTSFNGGGNNQTDLTDDSTEANLDCQYVTGVAYPIPITEYSTAGCGPINPDQSEAAGSCSNEPYQRFLSAILALPNNQLPQTLSVSYGDDEQTWPRPLAQKICSGFGQLAARGVSVMFASGDSGPSGAGGICENNAGTARRFVPSFPASCNWITAVGATQGVPETVASFSGGGFSNYFARPSYQDAAVSAYLKKLGKTFSGYYNASGRGYPDVAAQGVNFVVVDKGVTEPVAGTSAASPTFASVIALLNAARKASGQKPLGFLNPMLYSAGGMAALNDITTGGSTGCNSGNLTIPNAGFNASSGWDAVSGLGTPDFGKLLALVAPSVKNTGGVIAA